MSFNDHDLDIAFFLHKNPGWRPEDLGYPVGDYILFDLLRLLSA